MTPRCRCGHDAERHGPDAGGCIECPCLVTSSAASGVTHADGEDEMLRHYSAALDEIWRLRSAMAYEAGVLAAHLDYRTFPKSRRAIATQQLARMTAVASGSAATPYSHVSSRSMEHARRLAGVGTLTRHKWESR